MTCQKCEQQFYFNNKLYKHLKTCKSSKKLRDNRKTTTHLTLLFVFVVKSINKRSNFNDFAFRVYYYAIVKKILIFLKIIYNLCLNNDTFISLIDKNFLLKCKSNIVIKEITSVIKIKDIKSKIHNSSEYAELDLYIFEKIKNELTTTYVKVEFYLINNLKLMF